MTFTNSYNAYNWDNIQAEIYAKTCKDVEIALQKNKRDLEDFKALISPAALPYLEQMAQISRTLTLKRFGRTIQMFNPLYLSNECNNGCTYCGFNHKNNIKRIILNDEEIIKETKILKSYGFEHILLVTGESPKKAGFEYLKNALNLVKPYCSLVSMEVQPLDTHEYAELVALGLNTVYIYQETYNNKNYKNYHPRGKKSDFNYRLETPDRLGHAGIYKIGLGVLLGLENWRTDSFFTALHLKYLEQTYWQSKYSISFPRLRPATGIIEPKIIVSDKEMVQLICAYRLLDEEVELSISTRESEKFRNNIIKMGVTSMSAGARTNPGGYANKNNSLEQFHVADERSPKEIAEMVHEQGYEVVWKDWDQNMQ